MNWRCADIVSSSFFWRMILSVCICICNRKRWMSGMMDASFFVWSLQRENHDVLVIRRILRRWTWIRMCVLILMRRRERTFTVFVLCYALMIYWVIVWDVAVLWFEMCPFWCVGGDVYRTISSYYVSVFVFNICFVCSRVWCGEFVFLFQFCFRFNSFEVACISRSMYMQVACIKLIHVGNLCFV